MADFSLSEHKSAVKAFNERMAAAQRGNYTWLPGYQSFEAGSQVSKYRNLYGTSRSGYLKLRTDFSKMSEAELELQQKIMEHAIELGTTKTEAQQIYEEVYGEEPTEEEFEEWGEEVEEITEDSLRRYYYNENTHETTVAVDKGITKFEAIADLIQLKHEGHYSNITGNVYARAIDAHLKRKYADL